MSTDTQRKRGRGRPRIDDRLYIVYLVTDVAAQLGKNVNASCHARRWWVLDGFGDKAERVSSASGRSISSETLRRRYNETIAEIRDEHHVGLTFPDELETPAKAMAAWIEEIRLAA